MTFSSSNGPYFPASLFFLFFVEHCTLESNNFIKSGNQILHLLQGMLFLFYKFLNVVGCLCWGSARGVNLRSSEVFSETVPFYVQ